jgi:hypothetical protein
MDGKREIERERERERYIYIYKERVERERENRPSDFQQSSAVKAEIHILHIVIIVNVSVLCP